MLTDELINEALNLRTKKHKGEVGLKKDTAGTLQ